MRKYTSKHESHSNVTFRIKNIRKFRAVLGWSQMQLAEKIEYRANAPDVAIANCERKRTVTPNTLEYKLTEFSTALTEKSPV